MSKMLEMSFSFSLNVMLSNVEDFKDRSNTPKGCNAMYVKDGKRTYTHIFAHNFLNMVWFECNAIYVEDRSNTPKGCYVMYVEDGKRTYTHIFE